MTGRDDEDWEYRAARLLSHLGFDEARLRWRFLRLGRSLNRLRLNASNKAQHLGWRHQLCPSCGAVQGGDGGSCSRCDAKLPGRVQGMLTRAAHMTPASVSPAVLLILGFVLVYARMVQVEPAATFLGNFSSETLFLHGGHWPYSVREGEVWRLLTSVFVHAGLWHIAFNAVALWQIGPQLEEVFGRARTLFFFVATGLLASLASDLFLRGIGVGASGAVMGLIGVAAGFGHKDGTSIGRALRDRMLQWGLVCVVFGFFIGADNVAHVGGFVAGGAFGYLSPPSWQRRAGPSPRWATLGLLAGVLAVLSVLACLWPLSGPPPWR